MRVMIIIANTYGCYYDPDASLITYCLHVLAHLMLMAALPGGTKFHGNSYITIRASGTEAFSNLWDWDLNQGQLAPESMLVIIVLFRLLCSLLFELCFFHLTFDDNKCSYDIRKGMTLP